MKISWKYSVLAFLLLCPFLYAMGFTFPFGDDFARSNEAKHLFDVLGGFHELGRAWWKWSGRYTHHFLIVFLGDAALGRMSYALVCAGLALLYFVSFYGIFSTLQGPKARRESVFLAMFCLLGLYCGHQNINPTYYVITDILSLGLANGLVLTFIWALCRLWFAPAVGRGTIAFPIISGILAIGCYEHSALASFLVAGTALFMASIYRHPHLKAFRKVFIWIAVFFLLSFFCRGNFRRQTKRGASADIILEQLAGAWGDWLSYGFQLFSSGLLIPALAAGCLLRPRWRQSLACRLSLPGTVLLVVLLYGMLSLGIVLVHAVSDVTIGDTAKLPASLALLGAYLLTFGLLACGDGIRRFVPRLPAWLVILPLLAALCWTANMKQSLVSLLRGEAALYAASQEQRYAWLRSPQARTENPTLVADLGVSFFPAGTEAFQPEPESWPNKHIAEMLGLSAVRRLPLDGARALAAGTAKDAAPRLRELVVPEALKALGVERLRLGLDLPGGPNPAFARDWLFVSTSELQPVFRVLVIPADGGPRLVPAFVQGFLRERLLRQAETGSGFSVSGASPSGTSPFVSVEKLAGMERAFQEQKPLAGLSEKNGTESVYALPVYNPAAGAMGGLYLGLGEGLLYRIEP